MFETSVADSCVVQGAHWLRDHRGADFNARLFMGKGLKTAKNAHNASPRDGPEDKARLWAALRSEFLRDDTGEIAVDRGGRCV